MDKSLRLTFRRGDWLAIGFVLLLAVFLTVGFALHAAAAEDVTVEIRLDGALVHSQPLTQDGVFTVEGDYTNTVTVRDGKIAVTHSDCPTNDCVYMGWLEHGGAIVCLPNGVEIRIVGSQDIDFVVG